MNSPLRPCALALTLLLVPVIALAQERRTGANLFGGPAASSSGSASASAPPGSAEQPAETPATPTAPVTAPDVVQLKDGSMLRGTIVEMQKQGDVTIQLPTGKTRTIRMSEVKYAGPESDRPKQEMARSSSPSERRSVTESERPERKVRTFVTVHSGEARIRFGAEAPNTTLHLKTHAAVAEARGVTAVATGYEVVCTAPCTATLPAGTHQFAVSRGRSKPIAADDMTRVSGDSVLIGEYKSMAGLRAAGWVIAGAGFLGGLLLMTRTEESCESSQMFGTSCTPEHPYITAGLLVGLIGMGIGVPLTFVKDSASVTVSPASSDNARQRLEGSSTARSLVPNGIALTGRF